MNLFIPGKLDKIRRKVSDTRGMTMAELMAVIIIIVILAAVIFINVFAYQRKLEQLERDKIGKEIYYAAQNHLTIARGEGYLELDQGLSDDEKDSVLGYSEGNGVYYFIYPQQSYSKGMNSILDLMLPYGSIDENTRIGGSYIIRYHKAAGRVMDVFYCSRHDSPKKYNHTFSQTDYTSGSGIVDTYAGDGKRKARRHYVNDSVLGWYGGDNGDWDNPDRLNAPDIKVVNKEQLYVKVWDYNSGGYSLKLIIIGETSGAKKSYQLLSDSDVTAVSEDSRISKSGTTYKIVLDDITTKGMHFANIESETDKDFIPGENLKIQAVAYSLSDFTSIEYSAEKTANSIFADNGITGANTVINTAYINNIRHLENMDYTISNLSLKDSGASAANLPITNGIQTDNLIWSDSKNKQGFADKINTINGAYPSIYKWDEDDASTDAGYYLPVMMSGYSYDGAKYSITAVKAKADEDGNSGLFGSLTGCTVKNSKLIDFDISNATNAGALAGTISGANSTVTNVIVVNSGASDDISVNGAHAGGLIGDLAGGKVQFSAASVRVNGSSTAGGLIGTSAGTVEGCYSGGHTKDGVYKEWIKDNGYDVTGGTVGGLIGAAGGTSVSYSYSTCSVSGSTLTGGLVGSANGTISKCYATGAVETEEITTKDDHTTNNKSGSFAGSLGNSASVSGCNYFSSINEVVLTENSGGNKKTSVDHLLGAVGDSTEENSHIKAIDKTTKRYEDFVGGTWGPAKPYDSTLADYYDNKYNLQNVKQLYDGEMPEGYTSWPDYFVLTHYGDWPAPEVFAFN